jgi:uncharacterized protein YecE (DUF72 family)
MTPKRATRVTPAAALAESVPNLYVGCASWTDRSLLEIGDFYPADVKTPEERLRYYAEHFRFVEVDSTYYTADFEQQAQRWVERTPPGFLFDVKAFRMLTLHQTPHKMLPPAVREMIGEPPEGKRNWYYRDLPHGARDELWAFFTRSLRPLDDAGKLGAVIVQLPPWAMPGPQSSAHIEECADRLEGMRVAVEFRNKYWLSDRNRRRTFAELRESGLSYVIVDEPQGFHSSVPLTWEVTNPALAVVRLHGRNAETWEKKGLKGASERFNYLYSDDELGEFLEPVRRVAQQASEVHLTFNNNYSDYPERNAKELVALLDEGTSPQRH